MPSRDEHDSIGMLVGGISALVSAPTSLSGPELVARVAGGAIGGRFGSRLPDDLEPANSSHHRSTMHSLAMTGMVGHAAVRQMVPAVNRAPHREQGHAETAGPVASFFAGFVLGMPIGYVSHTLTDAASPRSIPLLTRGF